MRSIILIGLLQGSWGGGKVGANVWNMKVSTRPGDLLLDPMAGTGTSCVAAAMLGRHFLGIEREKRYAEAALKRIDALKNSKVLYG